MKVPHFSGGGGIFHKTNTLSIRKQTDLQISSLAKRHFWSSGEEIGKENVSTITVYLLL